MNFRQLTHSFGNAQHAANSLLAACYQGVIKPLTICGRPVSGGAKKTGVEGGWNFDYGQSSKKESAAFLGRPGAQEGDTDFTD